MIRNMELKTYKQRVRVVLERHEKARNNDGTLLAHYIKDFLPNLVHTDEDGDWSIKLKDIKNMPPIENIRRSRQLIQNEDGEFLPTDKSVIEGRGVKEKNWRNTEVREAKQV